MSMMICRILSGALLLAAIAGCNSISKSKTDQAGTKQPGLFPFIKADTVNPVLIPDSATNFHCPIIGDVNWEAKDVFNPAAVVRHDTVFLLYRAEDKVGRYAGTSRIGLAWSTDGLHFTRHPVPVLYPDNDSLKKYEWEGGCEDPRVVEDSTGVYYMTYTAYDGDKARLMVATSRDLYHWEKHGPAFGDAAGGRYRNLWSKSGSIVCKYKNGKAVAVLTPEGYFMFWGDTNIFLATSSDLIHWRPVTIGEDDHLFGVLPPRKGKFDSDLVEPGPPALLTDSGIILLYNSRNNRADGDTTIAHHAYSASQAVFDKLPFSEKIIRADTPFLKPDKPYEVSGQVNQVCFIEGLVYYKEKWFLYYGTADSKIAVAVKE